jgi:hypothetical protein
VFEESEKEIKRHNTYNCLEATIFNANSETFTGYIFNCSDVPVTPVIHSLLRKLFDIS